MSTGELHERLCAPFRQRGCTPAGECFHGPVLGLYQVDGRLARAQMFYFDTVALAGFLANARS
jgi:hypothetical protein